MVWTDNSTATTSTNYEVFFRKSTNGGNTFGSTINLSSNTGFSFVPRIALAGSTVYVTWEDDAPGNPFEIFFKKSPNGGSTFGSAINLSSNTGVSLGPQIAVFGSNVYVTWGDNTPGNYEIFFKKSPNGGSTFGSAINLSSNSGVSLYGLQIAASGGNAYVVWQDDTPGNTFGNFDILFRKSNGGTINLSNSPGNSIGPQIAIS